MVPDKFNMVDMGGIDIVTSQGVIITGLYSRLVNSIAQCRYQCLYNWKFSGIVIPPSTVEMHIDEEYDYVIINDGITVTDDDKIIINGLIIPPVIHPLEATSNDVYRAIDFDGYNPVVVNVQPPIPKYEEVEPDYFGIATAYQALNSGFFQNDSKTQCLYIAAVEYGANYVVMLPETYGNRFRVGLWEGKEYSDFEPYLDSMASTPTQIYYGATMVTGGSELTGDAMKQRFFFTGVDGTVVIGTSNTSQLIRPILLKINQ